MTTHNFEDHPVPDGLAISHEEIVAKLYDMASYFAVELGSEGNYCAANITNDDVLALNLAISALGGTPVKLTEQDETERPGEDPVDMVPF